MERLSIVPAKWKESSSSQTAPIRCMFHTHPADKAILLNQLFSNCVVDAVHVKPTYRKPFDMIFERACGRVG